MTEFHFAAQFLGPGIVNSGTLSWLTGTLEYNRVIVNVVCCIVTCVLFWSYPGSISAPGAWYQIQYFLVGVHMRKICDRVFEYRDNDISCDK